MRQLLFALALLIAAPAFAEEAPTAAPGSIATGMIEQANAGGVFELVHNGQVSVRHVGSGLRCDFARDGAGGRLMLFPNLPRGDDVACDVQDGGTYTTIYATRFPFPSTLDEQIAGAEGAIRSRFPAAQALEPLTDVETIGLPPQRSVRFLVSRDGVQHFTSVSVAQVGPWTIKLRYTTPAPDAEAASRADLSANLAFASILRQIVEPSL